MIVQHLNSTAFFSSQIAGLRWNNVGKPFTYCLRLVHILFYIGLMLAQRLHIIHLSYGLEGDIPEYQPLGDTKALARYMSPDAEGKIF